MSSPLRRILKSERFDVAFWLPPSGVDNGAFTTYWAELADLEAGNVDPVLGLLADADVGGYVANPGGALGHRMQPPTHHLWVDFNAVPPRGRCSDGLPHPRGRDRSESFRNNVITVHPPYPVDQAELVPARRALPDVVQ